MKIFKIEVCNLHWIDGKIDDPEDLCLHGNILVVAGNHQLEYKDATVSSSALYFLKSITENHIFGKDNQMLPCCGFLYYPDKKKENISICGCPNGVDWTIKHKKSQVLFIFENGEEECFEINDYKKEVFRFVDIIEDFYKKCSPKILDDESKVAFEIFWNEWHRRREG